MIKTILIMVALTCFCLAATADQTLDQQQNNEFHKVQIFNTETGHVLAISDMNKIVDSDSQVFDKSDKIIGSSIPHQNTLFVIIPTKLDGNGNIKKTYTIKNLKSGKCLNSSQVGLASCDGYKNNVFELVWDTEGDDNLVKFKRHNMIRSEEYEYFGVVDSEYNFLPYQSSNSFMIMEAD